VGVAKKDKNYIINFKCTSSQTGEMHIITNQIDIFVQLPVEPEVFNFEKYHQNFFRVF
jgi:hypothetical protein